MVKEHKRSASAAVTGRKGIIIVVVIIKIGIKVILPIGIFSKINKKKGINSFYYIKHAIFASRIINNTHLLLY